MKKLTLAIIGCGAITEYAHVPAAVGLQDVELSALVDTNLPRAEALARRYGIARIAANVLDLPEPPAAAIVALPHDLHAPVCADLLRRGIHVLVEKPMALSVGECDRMIEAASEGRAVLAVGFVRRFFPEMRAAKEIIESGALGAIRGFDVREGRVYDWNPSSDFPLRRARAGGGVLIDAGVHVLDTLLHLLGSLRVTSYADDSYGGVEAEAEIELAFGRDSTGFVELSRTRELRNTTVIHGDEGALEIDLLRRRLRLGRGRSSMAPVAATGNSGDDVFRAQLEDWIAAIRLGRTASAGGVQGRRPVALIEACYASRKRLELPWMEPTRRAITAHAEIPA